MNAVFFDSNVLTHTLAEQDPREPVAAALLARGGVISVQVLNEFVAVARRKLRLSWPEVTDALAAIRACCPAPRPPTLATHEAALGLAERHGFPVYDALFVAAALEAGCGTLFSKGMQDGQVVEGRLTIRNSFAAAGSGLLWLRASSADGGGVAGVCSDPAGAGPAVPHHTSGGAPTPSTVW